jgi:hypothetical protein
MPEQGAGKTEDRHPAAHGCRISNAVLSSTSGDPGDERMVGHQRRDVPAFQDVPHDDPGERRSLVQSSPELSQRCRRRLNFGRRREINGHSVEAAADEVVLVGEVVIDQCRADTGRFGDGPHGHLAGGRSAHSRSTASSIRCVAGASSISANPAEREFSFG